MDYSSPFCKHTNPILAFPKNKILILLSFHSLKVGYLQIYFWTGFENIILDFSLLRLWKYESIKGNLFLETNGAPRLLRIFSSKST